MHIAGVQFSTSGITKVPNVGLYNKLGYFTCTHIKTLKNIINFSNNTSDKLTVAITFRIYYNRDTHIESFF